MNEAASGAPVRIWDLPVRICHWCFAVAIPLLWWTAENHEMTWHKRIGIFLICLLVFRILWGFVGSSTARFATFVRGPGAVIAYFRSGGSSHSPLTGHNPAGGWSVLALLAAMLVQAGSGLFAGDPFDGSTGPLNHVVGVMTADALTEWHKTFFYAVVALIALHLAAIVYYAGFKRDDLVRPMVTGSRPLVNVSGGIQAVPAWRVLACLAASVLLSGWLWSGAPPL